MPQVIKVLKPRPPDIASPQTEAGSGSIPAPGSRNRKLPRHEIDFLRGYYCCLAAIVSSHGENTYVGEVIHCAGSTEEIIRYADSGDVETLRDAGYLSENDDLRRGKQP